MHDQKYNWRYWWTMPLLIFAGILLPGLIAAPAAHADEETFLESLSADGIAYVNPSAMVSAGWAICSALRNGASIGNISEEIVTGSGGRISYRGAGKVVFDAARQLCLDQLTAVLEQTDSATPRLRGTTV